MITEPEEVWKPIKDFEDSYEVSSLGRVRTLARMVNGKFGGLRSLPARSLAPSIFKEKPYTRVSLCKKWQEKR